MTRGPTNTQVRKYFDKHAAGYDRQMGFCERHLLGEHRGWATSQATGDVLELAVGTGLNLTLYPQGVRRVLGVELSERMVDLARARINEAGIGDRIEVTQGDVQNLDLPGESFDTVLSTYTVCTIPNPEAALAEGWRVLRPGGRLILVEHGPAARPWVRAGQRLINPLSIRLQADHILRDPVPIALDAGFEIVDSDQTGWSGLVYRVVAAKPQAA